MKPYLSSSRLASFSLGFNPQRGGGGEVHQHHCNYQICNPPTTTKSISLPLCYLRFSLVSTKAKALNSTSVFVSYAHQHHHHHLYSRRSPLSLSAFGSTFASFVFGCIWVAMVIGFNLECEKLDNLAWVWNLGIWVVGFVDLKKIKVSNLKELKKVFRSCCKMSNFLCFTDTFKCHVTKLFFTFKKQLYFINKKFSLNGCWTAPVNKSHLNLYYF